MRLCIKCQVWNNHFPLLLISSILSSSHEHVLMEQCLCSLIPCWFFSVGGPSCHQTLRASQTSISWHHCCPDNGRGKLLYTENMCHLISSNPYGAPKGQHSYSTPKWRAWIPVHKNTVYKGLDNVWGLHLVELHWKFFKWLLKIPSTLPTTVCAIKSILSAWAQPLELKCSLYLSSRIFISFHPLFALVLHIPTPCHWIIFHPLTRCAFVSLRLSLTRLCLKRLAWF